MDQQLSSAEWDFSALNPNEAKSCVLWEFARESAYIRNLPNNWESLISRSPSISAWQLWPFLNRTTTPFPSTPWLDLSDDLREDISSRFLAGCLVVIKGREMAEKTFALQENSEARAVTLDEDDRDLSSAYEETRAERRDYVTIVIDPKTWGTYTNNQLRKALRQVVDLRPTNIPEPKNEKGKKDTDRIAALRWLGSMRLSHHYELDSAMDFARPDQEGSFFSDNSQFAWSARERWDEARTQAKAKMHELFPFLPKDEKPISYTSYSGRKE